MAARELVLREIRTSLKVGYSLIWGVAWVQDWVQLEREEWPPSSVQATPDRGLRFFDLIGC